jgi:hypothetical protein
MAVAEVVAEEVATNLEEIAEVTRRIDTRAVGYIFGGMVIGASLGFYFGHRWNREKIKAEAFQQSEEEVDRIREQYRLRELARTEKPSAEEIIEERGYSVAAPRPLPPPVPISPTRIGPVIEDDAPKGKDDGWNYGWELANRSPDKPYVIHQDEFHGQEAPGYTQTAYTYYEVDDVLVDTDDTPLSQEDTIGGPENLKWGHGTDDIDVVFIRNDRLELEIEVCRLSKSYEEEVLGHDRNETN